MFIRGLTISRFGRFRFLFPSIFASLKLKSVPPRFRFRFRGSNYHQKILREAGGRFPFPIPVFASSLQVPPRAARSALDGGCHHRTHRVRGRVRSLASPDLGTCTARRPHAAGAQVRRWRARVAFIFSAAPCPRRTPWGAKPSSFAGVFPPLPPGAGAADCDRGGGLLLDEYHGAEAYPSQLEESFVEPTQYGPPPDPSLLGAARMGLMLRPQAYAAAAAAAEGGTPFQPGALSGGAFMTPQSAGGPSASSFDPTWQSWPQGQSCAENCAFVGHGGAGFGLGTGADSPASRSYERRGSEVRLPFFISHLFYMYKQ